MEDYNKLVDNVYKRVGGNTTLIVDSVNPKSKTFIGLFTDGKSISMQIKSLTDNRLWEYIGKKDEIIEQPLDSEIIEVPKEEPKEEVIENTEESTDTVEESDDNVVEESDDSVDDTPKFLVDVLKPMAIKCGGDVKIWGNVPNMYIITDGKKGKMEVYAGKKRIKVRAYETIVPKGIDYKSTKYFMGATILLEYNKDSYKKLEKLISLSVGYKKPRKLKKED